MNSITPAAPKPTEPTEQVDLSSAPSLSLSPRQPRRALLMSLVLPGFGQLYNGEVNKAIHLFLGFAFLVMPGVALAALYLPSVVMLPALLLGLVATLGVWFYGMVDAWRGAKARTTYRVQSWQLGGVYLLVFLLCNAMTLPLLIDYVRSHQVAAYRIPSTSMVPSVLQGDLFFADKRYNCPGCAAAVQRGDVALFTYPNNRTLTYIKRVIALPGDRVQLQGREVRVNDKPLTEVQTQGAAGWTVTEAIDGHRWQVQWNPSPALPHADIDMVVPPGQAFVLGDNRNESQDSRKFGTVPLQDIVGRARQVWFSWSPSEGVRWARLGRVIE